MWVRVLMLTVVGILVGCHGQARDTRPVAGSWFADVRAMGEHGHSGFAVVTLLPDGGTRANLTLSGGSAGGVHPWHIHEGTCSSGGPIVGDPSAYPVLQPDAGGNASATVALDVGLSTDADYHVNIHQSPDDDTVVGCGDLRSNS